ncbi:hypothetical protein BVRB_2g045450 [Beta vulgaris subsp. vulgaris]|uniref:Uncharacterized protein n=1 Tax=Beta vulgaris subsp. vulgaris TaxID=3555 RepID=A0A0J8E8F5_BETVV|nr:hypothetical protein BVRB_2g045450 [Beta vulgaris subsp. vulgaris]
MVAPGTSPLCKDINCATFTINLKRSPDSWCLMLTERKEINHFRRGFHRKK